MKIFIGFFHCLPPKSGYPDWLWGVLASERTRCNEKRHRYFNCHKRNRVLILLLDQRAEHLEPLEVDRGQQSHIVLDAMQYGVRSTARVAHCGKMSWLLMPSYSGMPSWNSWHCFDPLTYSLTDRITNNSNTRLNLICFGCSISEDSLWKSSILRWDSREPKQHLASCRTIGALDYRSPG